MSAVTDRPTSTLDGGTVRASSIARFPRRLAAAAVAKWSAYLLVSYVVLYPVIVAPVIADDFVNPFAQVDDGGPSLLDGLRFGWDASIEGGSFRLLGSLTGSVVSWAVLWTSATFDVHIATVWGAVKFVMAILCACAVAFFGRAVAAACGRAIGVFESVTLVSAALFGTLQIHAAWSNDPVANYPLVGYGAAALGFTFLAAVVHMIRRPDAFRIVVAAAAAVAAVSYYEVNVGAVIGAAWLLVPWMWGCRRTATLRWRSVAASLVVVLAPALLVLAGRRITGDNVNYQGYEGTSIRLAGAARTFFYGVVGSLPGTAWRLSVRTLGGTLGLVSIVFATVVLLSWIAVRYRRAVVGADQPERISAVAPTDARVGPVIASTVAAAVTYWFVAVGIHALTVKVQNETLGLGYVYASYMIGACVVALGVASMAYWFSRRAVRSEVLFATASLLLALVFVQSTINWRLSERLNDVYISNRRLLDAFDDDAVPPERCRALSEWTALAWPDYYEQDTTDGIQRAYERYFGEPFCDGFVRPP